LKAQWQERGTPPGAQETEVADAHEAFWQHVQQEAPEELVHVQTHEALLVVMC
jgi:hypothetical protein